MRQVLICDIILLFLIVSLGKVSGQQSDSLMILIPSGEFIMGNDIQSDSLLPHLFKKVELKATINNKYFREDGTKIYLCESPTEYYRDNYKSDIKNFKDRYR